MIPITVESSFFKPLTRVERNELTVKQEVFLDEYLSNGFQGRKAILKAYDTKHPSIMLQKSLKNPKIKEAIEIRREELRNRFVVEAEIAFNFLMEIIQDEKAPKHVRLTAAKDILDRAGLGAVHKQEVSGTINIDTPATRELIKRARFIEENTIDITPIEVEETQSATIS